MSKEELAPYPTDQDRARLRLLHSRLLRILMDPVSKTKINFVDGETLFHERVYSNEQYRISSPVRDPQSVPSVYSTFVTLVNAPLFIREKDVDEESEARGYIIVVPPDVEQSFLIPAKEVEQQNPRHSVNLLPTNPEVIHKIIAQRNIMPQPIKESVLNPLLYYVVNLETRFPAENNR